MAEGVGSFRQDATALGYSRGIKFEMEVESGQSPSSWLLPVSLVADSKGRCRGSSRWAARRGRPVAGDGLQTLPCTLEWETGGLICFLAGTAGEPGTPNSPRWD